MKGSRKLAITLGDPAGIGPEITVKALAALDETLRRRVVLFAHRDVFQDALRISNLQDTPLCELVTHRDDCLGPHREPTLTSGAAQVEYLEAATQGALEGSVGGLVTAPISKTWAQKAGFPFPGHTEFLEERFGAKRALMMFAGPKLKVVLATVHCALAEVPRRLNRDALAETIVQSAHALASDFGVAHPRLGILGLNPHAGEEGRFGREEEEVIKPAILEAMRALAGRADVVGPLVPDAAFRATYDCFVAMYHDQGLIAVKLVDFDESVNTTLGLPVVRTSPDHGVAYDIAGRGIARPTSMEAAVRLAFQLIDRRATSEVTAG